MVLKRQINLGGEGSSENRNRTRPLPPNLFKRVHVQEYLEPIIRKMVQEAVESSFQRYTRNFPNQIDCSGSRTLRLRFERDFHRILFTNQNVVSGSAVKVVLYDSKSRETITSGPFSSIKVSILVLDADFCPDDRDDWTKKEFDGSVVQNREGKRPLVLGELIVELENGVGHIREVLFTDNSSWRRSGKFRLAAKANTHSDQIREAISNPFRVKDQRGESYKKHYPPKLDDEVWRLEKIAKDGSSHKSLAQHGVTCVRDFLRLYVSNQSSLLAMLPNISKRTWLTILDHARTCSLDDAKYLYKTSFHSLLFNSIYEVIGVTDGQSWYSLDNLDVNQMRKVENLKQLAYKSVKDIVPFTDASTVGYPMLLGNTTVDNLTNPVLDNILQEQDQLEMQLNTINLQSISRPYNHVPAHVTNSFEFGESSHQMQGFIETFRNGSGIRDSPGGFYDEKNYIETHLSTNDIPIDCSLFLDSTNHEIETISHEYGALIPPTRMPGPEWCKVLAVVKWRILVRRNVAARKWQRQSNYFLCELHNCVI